MKSHTNLLTRSAYYLDDYIEMFRVTRADDEDEFVKDMCIEMAKLSKGLKGLLRAWDLRQKFTSHLEAAKILCGMLDDWELPGSVWYLPSADRFRLCGTDYESTRDEICCGVYMPGTTPENMAEDLELAIAEGKQRNAEIETCDKSSS